MKPLQGCSILVTRPQQQAQPFCQRLEQAGAKVFHFPTIHIESTELDEQTLQTLNQLEQQDIILFTSVNAVHFCLPWLQSFINKNAKPPNTSSLNLPFQIGAIGKKTAQHLRDNHLNVPILPSNNFNSESLLALPAMQSIAHKNILIVKGKGGRSLLRDSLQARGANVKCVSLYSRQCPVLDKQMLNDIQSQKIDIITLTSVESSENLFSLLKDQSIKWLAGSTLLLGSQRIYRALSDSNNRDNIRDDIRNHIRERKNPFWVAKNPTDDAMFAALLEWKKQHLE
ncbi:MAG: uroporphyrinogen-III synthase [Thiotrichaceae bacterium]